MVNEEFGRHFDPVRHVRHIVVHQIAQKDDVHSWHDELPRLENLIDDFDFFFIEGIRVGDYFVEVYEQDFVGQSDLVLLLVQEVSDTF